MNHTPSGLIRFDRYSWYFFSVWFGAATLILLLAGSFARDLAFWGLILLLVNAAVRLTLVAWQFHHLRRQGLFMLCWLLLAILAASVVTQLLLRK
jgi:hypothetical protein